MGIIAFALAGCGGNSGNSGDDLFDGGNFTPLACEKFSNCGSPIPNCQQELAALVLSSSCQQTFIDVPCTGPEPADLLACFPSCSGSNQTCNGDQITVCENGIQLTFDCVGVCEAGGGTYLGACSLSYMGQTATEQGCWCTTNGLGDASTE